MTGKLEYPLSMFFKQLHWAWINWHSRPNDEESKWHGIVIHFAKEIRTYFKMKEAVKRRP